MKKLLTGKLGNENTGLEFKESMAGTWLDKDDLSG